MIFGDRGPIFCWVEPRQINRVIRPTDVPDTGAGHSPGIVWKLWNFNDVFEKSQGILCMFLFLLYYITVYLTTLLFWRIFWDMFVFSPFWPPCFPRKHQTPHARLALWLALAARFACRAQPWRGRRQISPVLPSSDPEKEISGWGENDWTLIAVDDLAWYIGRWSNLI